MIPKSTILHIACLITTLSTIGCHVGPQPGDQRGFDRQAAAMVPRLEAIDPQLRRYFQTSHAQAIFPVVGEGGLVVGNGWGQGAVFVDGEVVGYASVSEHSIGGVVGGEKFSVVIFFETRAALASFQSGGLKWDASAGAVAGTSGVSTKGEYDEGVVVFDVDQEGLMANASVGIAVFSYESVAAWTRRNAKTTD